MINQPIRGQGKGLCWGGKGECMATGCKWSPAASRSSPGTSHPPLFQGSLLIIAESHSAAGENKHCFIYANRFANEPPWTTLWVSAQCDSWERGFSLILFSQMMHWAPFWYPYLSHCIHIISRTSHILLTWRRNCPADITDGRSYFFSVDACVVYVCSQSLRAAPRPL